MADSQTGTSAEPGGRRFPSGKQWRGFKKIEIKEEDRVSLPTIFGVKPGRYLAALYGAAAILALFFVLVFPGLSKPGSVGIFSSEPAGSAVRVDGVTLGYTPCEIFLPKGKRAIEMVLPGFEKDAKELEVKGRIFGSLFFPRKVAVAGKLVSPDPAGAFAISALEYQYWSSAEVTESYQSPMSLSEGAYRTGPAAGDPAVRKAMRGVLENSLRYTATRAAARDLLRASFLLDNAGLSPSPLTALRSIQGAANRMGETNAVPWLAELLPAEAYARLVQSAWYRKYDPAGGGETAVLIRDLPFQFAGTLNVGNIDFISVNSGSFTKYGKSESMPPIFMARSLLTQAAWDAFTAENPEWSAAGREALISRGFVGEDYLVAPDHPGYPAPAAPGISWYAAAAYCAWLTSKLPSVLSGWEARLPSENEWEFAIRQFEDPANNFGMLWEWCADMYAPLDFFPAQEEALKTLEKAAGKAGVPFPERVVRGGSWINPPGSVGVETRGSLPPECSSPFVGFRPVIVPKRGT